MSDAIDITLTAAYRIAGQVKTIGSQCRVDSKLASELIKRNKAELYEPTEAESDSDGGE